MVPAGRALPPSSPYADDDGACPPGLARALAQRGARDRVRAVVAALATDRVLVPVLAHLDERGRSADGVAGEKVASAATVTVRAPDGRAAVPVFSGVATAARWDPAARPVPVAGARAAASAAVDADGLVVLDPAGPTTVLLPRPAVWALAQGREWLPSPEDPLVAREVAAALGDVAAIEEVRCEPGDRAELRVVLAVRPGLDRSGLDAVLAAAGRALGAVPVVAERVDSLELRVVASRAQGGPGRRRRG